MGCGASAGGRYVVSDPHAKQAGCVPVVVEYHAKISDHYVLQNLIGEGTYGSVCTARHKRTGQERAVKSVARSKQVATTRVRQEASILKGLTHPNVIRLYETFDDNKYFHLVMPVCQGGELWQRIIEAGSFSEMLAAVVMQQIVSAVHYLHDQGVCHRDVKPENMMFASHGTIETNVLKIIDFGLACRCNPDKFMTTRVGTPYYMAPQVIRGVYKKQSDIWSCGVIMYVLLCGYPPFDSDNELHIFRKAKEGKVIFYRRDWSHISKDARDLVRRMLTVSETERISPGEALSHSWVGQRAPRASTAALPSNFFESLQSFRTQCRLNRAAWHVVAGEMNEEQVRVLRETFTALDVNGDGQLTKAEMRRGLENTGIAKIPPDLDQILEDVYADKSGSIDYNEFLAATLDKTVCIDEAACFRAFQVFDSNDDGVLSRAELSAVLGEESAKGNNDALSRALSEGDTNGDGCIEFDEFLQMMRRSSCSPDV